MQKFRIELVFREQISYPRVTALWLHTDWPGIDHWALKPLLFSSFLSGWDVRLGTLNPTQRSSWLAQLPGLAGIRPC